MQTLCVELERPLTQAELQKLGDDILNAGFDLHGLSQEGNVLSITVPLPPQGQLQSGQVGLPWLLLGLLALIPVGIFAWKVGETFDPGAFISSLMPWVLIGVGGFLVYKWATTKKA